MKTSLVKKFTWLSSGLFALAIMTLTGCGGGGGDGQRFLLRITNVSTPETIQLSDGSTIATPLSPGVLVVHTAPGPFFSNNAPDRGEGLEAIAEDGSPAELAASLGARVGTEFESVTVFNTPVGATEPGPIFPGDSYEIEFTAEPGDRVNFATMFVQSNDLFFGPAGPGIALFDDAGNPVSGDFTAQSPIWDAGTEINQPLGEGPDQVVQQAGPNTGAADPNNAVRLIPDPAAEGLANLPADADVIQVTIELVG